MDLRCDNGIKFGDVSPEEGWIEVKCRSRRCGHEAGVVILHRFDLKTGALKGTTSYKDPVRKENDNADRKQRPAVRSA